MNVVLMLVFLKGLEGICDEWSVINFCKGTNFFRNHTKHKENQCKFNGSAQGNVLIREAGAQKKSLTLPIGSIKDIF